MFLLRILGWKETGVFPEMDKMIVIIAPHTSMMDFVIGRMYYYSVGRRPRFIIKKELFFFPLGLILKAFGAIPVNREKGVGIIDQVVQKFHEKEKFIVNITPEGTRKKTERWKKGFYEIAIKSNIPVAIGTIDYGKKEIGIMELFYPTGDYKKDINFIKSLYIGRTGRHPENFILVYE